MEKTGWELLEDFTAFIKGESDETILVSDGDSAIPLFIGSTSDTIKKGRGPYPAI